MRTVLFSSLVSHPVSMRMVCMAALAILLLSASWTCAQVRFLHLENKEKFESKMDDVPLYAGLSFCLLKRLEDIEGKSSAKRTPPFDASGNCQYMSARKLSHSLRQSCVCFDAFSLMQREVQAEIGWIMILHQLCAAT